MFPKRTRHTLVLPPDVPETLARSGSWSPHHTRPRHVYRVPVPSQPTRVSPEYPVSSFGVQLRDVFRKRSPRASHPPAAFCAEQVISLLVPFIAFPLYTACFNAVIWVIIWRFRSFVKSGSSEIFTFSFLPSSTLPFINFNATIKLTKSRQFGEEAS